MKFQNLYIGTIVGWVLVVLFEVIGALFGAWQMKRAKLPLKVLYLMMKYGRRTLLFLIAVVNLILLIKAQKKSTPAY
jgi:TRAP-type C4-dicarboxylate transport system permease large subunit